MARKRPLPRATSTFPKLSFTTNEFRWLHNEGWEDALLLYFAANRSPLPEQIFASPPLVRRAFKNTNIREARWILTLPESMEAPTSAQKMVAWAEIQSHFSRFRVIYLLISQAKGLNWSSDLKEALSLLVSGVFIAAGADIIYVVSENSTLAEEFASMGWGSQHPVLTPKANLTLEAFNLLAIASEAWWQLPNAQKDQVRLRYLSGRLKGDRHLSKPRQKGLLPLLAEILSRYRRKD